MKTKISEFIATGFYSGYLPKAPGTWGSLVAAIIIGFFSLYGEVYEPFTCLFLAFISTAIGIPTSEHFSNSIQKKDPGCVVIDEFAGQFLAFTLVPLSGLNLILGFLTFRIFDILKPWPADKLQNLPGGYGIVIDDVAAGFYAMITTFALDRLIALL
jgi:phosphatidylglycerophosphatase A